MTELLEKVISFAKEKHNGQKRRNGADYFTAHVEKVAKMAEVIYNQTEDSVDYDDLPDLEIVLAAAYLHDVVEDCGVSLEEIVSLCGGDHKATQIMVVVDLLTRRKGERYFAFIQRMLIRFGKLYLAAAIVKLADLRCNMMDFEDKDKQGSLYAKYEFAEHMIESYYVS